MARRRRLLSVLAVLVAAVLTAGVGEVVRDQHDPLRGIKGDDDRIHVNSSAYPWSTIGRLTKGDGSLCSAVMIGPSTALTAAHCLWNDRTGTWMPANAVFLSLGWDRGEWVAASLVKRVEVNPAFISPSNRDLSRSVEDWAVLHLVTPVGRVTGWLGVAGLTASTYGALVAKAPVIMQAGYSMDRRHILTAHVGCRITGWVAEGVVAHDCDATRGDSGSPLFAWIDGEFQILGTHVSSFKTGNGVYGAAIASGSLPQTARGNAGRAVRDEALMKVLRKGT